MNNNYDIVSDLYDIYVKFDFDIDFYLRKYHNFKGTVLELMAGTGRLSIPLLKNGISLDCVDLSQALLDKLSQKLAQNTLHSNLYCQDICSLNIPHKYDAIIIGCNSFAEITDRENRKKVLQSVHGLLNRTGEFVITLHNPLVRRKSIDNVLTHIGNYKAGNNTISFSISSNEDQNAVVHLNQFYEIYGSDGCMLEKKMINLHFALIAENEIEKALVDEGFKIKEIFGDFDNSTFDEDSSPYIIIIAVKE